MPFCKALFFIPFVAPILVLTSSGAKAASNPKPILPAGVVKSIPPNPAVAAATPSGVKAPFVNAFKTSLPPVSYTHLTLPTIYSV